MPNSLLAAEALFQQGNRHMAAQQWAQAEISFRQALDQKADLAEVHANLGLVLQERGRVDEAHACYQRALALAPLCAPVHLNLGGLYARRKQFQLAEQSYAHALALNPVDPGVWSNLGALYTATQQPEDAEACLRKALTLEPGHAGAAFNLAYLLLRQGHFEEGWLRFEARDWYAGLAAYFSFPRWRGEPLNGRSLLIGYEGGHGDMIQLCRYVPLLKARGAGRIAMLCHPPLKTLLAPLPGLDEVIGFDEEIPRSGWDYWTPPLSLPLHFGTRLDSVPAAIPYLTAAPERLAAWQPRLPSAGFKVGIAWKGNPKFENDAERSLPTLETLRPLARVAGVRLVSLQKGAGESEARHPPEGMEVTDLGSDVADFADMAAVLSCLDLVICVDTAVGHLAGALGQRCWLLLPDYMTDWRWLSQRSDSPWYPETMRLFRQPQQGGWAVVVGEVAAALAALVASQA